MSKERLAQRLSTELHEAHEFQFDGSKEHWDLLTRAAAELRRLDQLINSPLTEHFLDGVRTEAAFQTEQWSDEDADKTPEDWFWTLGYLSQKAIQAKNAGNLDKALHHTISSAALLCRWHEYIKVEIPNVLVPVEPEI